MSEDELDNAAPGERGDSGSRSALGGFVRYCREHPYRTAILVVFTITGAVCAAVLPIGESLSMPRRIIAGALAGALFALAPLGARLYD